MRVFIGKYKPYIGIYQIAEMLKYFGASEKTIEKFGEWLCDTPIDTFLTWVDRKRSYKKVKVKIHDYDVWNMDSTLAYIILPMLKRFVEAKNSTGFVEDCDVPENLRSDPDEPKEHEHDWDSKSGDRWDWVLSEMIWAFEQIHPDNDWEYEYTIGSVDTSFTPAMYDKEYNVTFKPSPETDFNLPIDKEKYVEYNKRIKNGLELFGKYYRSLWD